MPADTLLRELQSAGFRLHVEGDRVIVSPASRLTDDHRRAIKAEKPALLALLAVPTIITFAVTATCTNGHQLDRGGLACTTCRDSRCVGCGAWMGKPNGAFCTACHNAQGETA